MFDVEQAKSRLLDIVGADFNIAFKKNDKGIITVTFTDEDTHEKVNFKFNTNTNVTTIAPREMEKETFKYCLKDHITGIKDVLMSLYID